MDLRMWFSLAITGGHFLDIILCQDNPRYWYNQAEKEIRRFRNVQDNTNIAKNIIFILGDGMGVSTVTAARILKGQLQGKTGEETVLHFETFDNIGLAKTYNVDYQVADSAGTATAFLSGVKARKGTLGVDGRVERGNCALQIGREVKSIMHWAQEAGKSVGIVTTSRITHASPAANYAHSADRKWEGDSKLTEEAISGGCLDIAKQLIIENKNIQVIMGGGRRFFLKTDQQDPEKKNATNFKYHRKDTDLIELWKNDKEKRNVTHEYVWNKGGFDQIDPEKTDYVLGLFAHSHMSYQLERDTGPNGDPHPAEMTEKAIKILRRNPNGFYLFVESARIDHAHHANWGKKALYETIALDDVAKVVTDMTNPTDTLTMVTADHSHGFMLVGSPPRGNDVIGLSHPYDEDEIPRDTILGTSVMYINGPGHRNPRRNFTAEEVTSNNFRQDSIYWLVDSTHGGEEVGIYAQGPMSHLIRTTHEQSYIAHVMAYSACIGPYKDKCDRKPMDKESVASAVSFYSFYNVLLLCIIMLSNVL